MGKILHYRGTNNNQHTSCRSLDALNRITINFKIIVFRRYKQCRVYINVVTGNRIPLIRTCP